MRLDLWTRCGLTLGFAGMLTGCSVSVGSNSTHQPGGAIHGVVHGGQQPIHNMHVYLLAANMNGYGGASASLLNATATGNSDGVGGYVLSGPDGSFSITGDYSCTAGTQVYLYGLGGDAGAGTNAAAGLMAALGDCGKLSGSTFVSMNEVSTVAAAYALAGFAVDATHVSSSGSALAQVGVANAFAAAANLETLAAGAALTTTPAGDGTVPQATINTLADVLAACINSDGTIAGPANATACYTLLNNALSGRTTGTAPADTASAAINIAHNPVANIAALYGLATSTSPFQPTLSAAPNDWTVAITYSPAGLAATYSMAIDAAGDVWLANVPSGGPYSLTELSSQGALLSPAGGYTGGGLTKPNSLAIDPAGNVWVAGATNVVEFNGSNGAVRSGANGYSVGGANSPFGIAVDGQGDVWVGDGTVVVKMDGSGNILSGPSGFPTGTGGAPWGVSIDGAGHAWSGSGSLGVVSELSSSGAVMSGTGYPVANFQPEAIAFDAGGNAWTNSALQGALGLNTVAKLSPGGAVLSPASGYTNCVNTHSVANNTNTLCIWWNPDAFALDGGGNVWGEVATQTQFIGMNPFPTYATGVSEISNTGTILSGAGGFTGGTAIGAGDPHVQGSVGATPYALAVDGSGNVWALLGSQVVEFVGAGVPVVTPFSLGVQNGTLGMRP